MQILETVIKTKKIIQSNFDNRQQNKLVYQNFNFIKLVKFVYTHFFLSSISIIDNID